MTTLETIADTGLFSVVPGVSAGRDNVAFQESLAAQEFAKVINQQMLSVGHVWNEFWTYTEIPSFWGLPGGFEWRAILPAYRKVIGESMRNVGPLHQRIFRDLILEQFVRAHEYLSEKDNRSPYKGEKTTWMPYYNPFAADFHLLTTMDFPPGEHTLRSAEWYAEFLESHGPEFTPGDFEAFTAPDKPVQTLRRYIQQVQRGQVTLDWRVEMDLLNSLAYHRGDFPETQEMILRLIERADHIGKMAVDAWDISALDGVAPAYFFLEEQGTDFLNEKRFSLMQKLCCVIQYSPREAVLPILHQYITHGSEEIYTPAWYDEPAYVYDITGLCLRSLAKLHETMKPRGHRPMKKILTP